MRDSHGLFDYESKSITKKSLKTSSQGKLVRINNEVELVTLSKNEKDIATEAQTLLQIKYIHKPDASKSIIYHRQICVFISSLRRILRGSLLKLRNGRG
jgi:hypothetical protein